MVGNTQRIVELKVELSAEQWQQLRANPAVAGAGEAPTTAIRSVYFDTADHALNANGIHLELQRRARKWRQIAWTGGVVFPSASPHIDTGDAIDGASPHLHAIGAPLAGRIRALAGDAELVPLFEINLRRSKHLLGSSEGGQIELALDEGSISADGAAMDLREARLRPISGGIDALMSWAEALFGASGCRFGADGKIAQGFRLLLGEDALRPSKATGFDASEPRYAPSARLSTAMTCEVSWPICGISRGASARSAISMSRRSTSLDRRCATIPRGKAFSLC
jgi:inorganic triphosphatase YgiF